MKFTTICVSALAVQWVQAHNPYDDAGDDLFLYSRRDVDDDLFDFDARDVYEAGYKRGLDTRDTDVLIRDDSTYLQRRGFRDIVRKCLDGMDRKIAESKKVYCPKCENYTMDQKTKACKVCACAEKKMAKGEK